jgi:hypothetical protein
MATLDDILGQSKNPQDIFSNADKAFGLIPGKGEWEEVVPDKEAPFGTHVRRFFGFFSPMEREFQQQKALVREIVGRALVSRFSKEEQSPIPFGSSVTPGVTNEPQFRQGVENVLAPLRGQPPDIEPLTMARTGPASYGLPSLHTGTPQIRPPGQNVWDIPGLEVGPTIGGRALTPPAAEFLRQTPSIRPEHREAAMAQLEFLQPGLTPRNLELQAFKPGDILVNKRTGQSVTLPGTTQHITNIVDQAVGIESKGKYRTVQQALDAGDVEIASAAFERAKLEIPTAIQRAGAQARSDIPLDQPAAVKSRSDIFDRAAFLKDGTLKPVARGTTERQMRLQDTVEISDQQRKHLAALDAAVGNTKIMFNIAKQLITATNPVEAGLQATRLYAGAVSRANPLATAYRADREAFASVTARAVGLESGVLTNYDVFRWERTLPNFGDTRQVVKAKEVIFSKIQELAVRATRRVIAGDTPNEARHDIEKELETLFSEIDKLEAAPKKPSARSEVLDRTKPPGP